MTLSSPASSVTSKKISYNPFRSGPVSLAVPTTEAQREMFATLIMDKDATLCYNESLVIDIHGDVNPGLLDLAFQEILKRHDALRSVFSSDGKFFFVKEYTPVRINFIDLSSFKDPDSELDRIKTSQVEKHFDLQNGPCFIGTLIKLNDQHYNLVITGHHIICDGWSFAILLSELSTIYSALVKNVPFQFEPSFQFSDYAIQEAANGPDHSHKDFWINQFKAPLNVKKLPLDYIRPKFRTYQSDRIEIEASEATVKKIKKFSASHGCSLYTTLMGTFQILLHKITQSEELVIGMASAAQSASGKNDLIGHLVNLLPLRTTIQPDNSVKAHLKSLRTGMLDAFDHQNFSFGSLLKSLNLKRDPAEIPLVSVVFNIDQQSSGQGLKFDGLSASYTTTPRTFENFELFVNVVSCENRIVVECQYNKNLFKASTIANWFESYFELFDQIMLNPEELISKLTLSRLHLPKPQEMKKEEPKTAPKSDRVDQKLIELWNQVLELDHIQNEDNFFSLGGHSLLAVELATLIQDHYKIDFSIRDIFENPVLSAMSAKLVEGKKDKKPELPLLVHHQNLNQFPVTHNQMQVWYLEEMFSGTLMHNLPSSIRLKFKVDRKILEKTLHVLVNRHPALRTSIVVEKGVPVQKVLPVNLVRLYPELELIHATENDIVQLLNDEASSVFNKETPPLFKAKLYQLGEEDFVFFFMVHHAIWDGWSFDIFFEELNTIYSALLENKKPTFVMDPEITYGDYALWLEKNVNDGHFDHQLKFWQQKLKVPLPVLELPTDFKRPVVASHEGGTFPFQLSKLQADNLRAYAKSQGTSVFNVLLTAFKVTLARYANVTDIIVGSPVRNRHHAQMFKTIGYFVNTVALRTQIQLNGCFEDNLKEVTKTCLEAFDHQDLPFQVVLNKVDYTRDSGRTPIFQTFFSFQDVSNREAILNGHPYVQINIDKGSTHTDLDLWVKASDKKIEGAFEYRKDLFKSISIQRLSECFLNLIDRLLLEIKVPLSNKSLLTFSQTELVLMDWNNTNTQSQSFLPFHKMFEEQVLKSPQALAVENAKGSLSYQQLNDLANRVAHGLKASGVGKGDLVGLSLNRDLNMMIAILGILKSGAGYVPLDPAFPQDRLDYMLESSTPKTLLTEPALEKRFQKFAKRTLIENLIQDDSLSTVNPNVDSQLTDTMYVIYTSGSTGNPKGVQVTHGPLANFLVSMSKAPGLSANDKLLAVTTLSFDIAALELYLPLTLGASLYLASSYDVIDGRALKSIIETRSISAMQATPSSWRLLLAAGWQGDSSFNALCGGEPFPIDLAQKLLNVCGAVWNMYGPTETTVWSTVKRLSLNDTMVTIGKPIDNTYCYILDENKNLAPIGAAGELFIGGLGLASGYFKRPDLTNEKFIPNPFRPGEKMYGTGDFARYLENGEIECLGRQDGQVKVRGYRIELGEIEACLSKFSYIKENAVITKETKPGDVRIIAFLVLRDNENFDEKSLRELLSQKLPKYMIPSHFMTMEDLPRTLNGKIDKKTLGTKVPDFKTAETQAAVEVKPVINEVDQELQKMWSEILNVNIKPTDNFFNTGGNSLLAVQLFSRVAQKYAISLPLSLLLEADTFEAFSKAVQLKLNGPAKSEVPSLPQAFRSIVSIKSSGRQNPVFCFHSVGGNVLNYMALVPALGDKRPLIGLQARGMDEETAMPDSIEAMATYYIREMKIVQPKGPYYLAGGSMGGKIALEVAQQLKQQGDSIEKLVMFDTFGPNVNIQKYDKSERNFFRNLKISLRYRKKSLVFKLRTKFCRYLGLPIPLEIRLFNVEMNNYKALWKYQPSAYDGDLHLIRGKKRAVGWYSDPLMGWEETIKGKILTYEISGSHHDFIESPELTKVFAQLL